MGTQSWRINRMGRLIPLVTFILSIFQVPQTEGMSNSAGGPAQIVQNIVDKATRLSIGMISINESVLSTLQPGTIVSFVSDPSSPGKGKALGAGPGDVLEALYDSSSPISQFSVERNGNNFSFKSVLTGKYLQVNRSSPRSLAMVSSPWAKEWETFTIEAYSFSKIFLKNSNGSYLSVRPPLQGSTFPIVAATDEKNTPIVWAKAWEQLKLVIIKSAEQIKAEADLKQALTPGATIAFRSDPSSPGKNKFLGLSAKPDSNGNFLVAAYGDPSKPETQFIVEQDQDAFFFKNVANNLYLTVNPTDYRYAYVSSKARTDAERFSVEGSIQAAFFRNKTLGGYLSVRPQIPQVPDGPLVRITDETNKIITWKQGFETIAIVPLKAAQGAPAIDSTLQEEIKGASPVPQDSAALAKLEAGTLIAIKSVGEHDTGNYLRLLDRRFLEPTGDTTRDPFVLFEVLRKGSWIGFKSLQAEAKNLQALPGTHEVRFNNRNFAQDSHTWEHWALIPDNASSLDVVWLQNQASGGFLRIPGPQDQPWDLEHVWTKRDANGRAARKEDPGTKFAIEVVQPVDSKFNTGGTSYIFSKARETNNFNFSENWKFGKPGKGSVKFKARGLASLVIILASSTDRTKLVTDGAYKILLGGQTNTQSKITRVMGNQASWVQNAFTNAQALIDGGWPLDGMDWATYWLSWDESTGDLKVGKGPEEGKNEVFSWRDPNPIKNLQYIAFGSYFYRIEFDSIEFSKAGVEKNFNTLGNEFKKAGSKIADVSVGSRNGNLEAWAVTLDKKLVKGSGDEQWASVATPDNALIESVSIGDDGSVYLVTDKGNVYRTSTTPAPQDVAAPAAPTQTPQSTIAASTQNTALVTQVQGMRGKRKQKRKGRVGPFRQAGSLVKSAQNKRAQRASSQQQKQTTPSQQQQNTPSA